ncbi:DUF1707 SHOCT-like domain-containing protein [Lentzea tibetensis]|uniref:DUF1707 SHOCT-like domain-containing protein n=1 Tax=Lentzea tibetensis TaxID=2591470 RepID=UPI0016485059|nr:DUF1707 domain-containing protein [Lentzea tibetensis]
MSGADYTQIRISDTERDEAVSTLAVHMSTGRLELADFEERSGRAAAARTRGELEALFSDLPAPHPDLSSATPPGRSSATAPGRSVVKAEDGPESELVETPLSSALEAVGGLTLLVGIPGAILLTIFQGMWWLFIPVGLVLIVSLGWSEAAKKPKSGA